MSDPLAGGSESDSASASALVRYVPKVASHLAHLGPGPQFRSQPGTLCFVDISGFTALSEKLARRGRVGAEELTEVLDRVFGSMLRLAYARRGSLLKFGGDALLLLFQGDDHAIQATESAIEMRAALREASSIPTSVGRIHLRMSVGLHTGDVDLFLVGDSHRELVVSGPVTSLTTDMEKAASAGQIVVSDALRAVLPPRATSKAVGPGWELRSRRTITDPPGPIARPASDAHAIATCVPHALRRHLGTSGRTEAEHRLASAGFLQFKGIDALLATGGRAAVAEALDSLVRTVQQAVEGEGVTFLGTDIDHDGGKIILVSGVPTTQEDDEGRMLRAARRVIESETSLPIRIGVNRGHVFAGEIGTDFRATFTMMGDTVNLAARLMAAAPMGQIYATARVLGLSHTYFGTEPVAPFTVKGKTEPVQAYVVGGESGTRSAHSHDELEFVGRDAELAPIAEAVTALRSGTGSSLAISGDTGIGKSRLVQEALQRHPVPAEVVITGEPNGVDNPYWAFRDPLRGLLGVTRRSQSEMSADLVSVLRDIEPTLARLAPLIGEATHIDVPDNDETELIEVRFRPVRVAAALVELLSALYPEGVVVVFEDIHWLDDASVDLIAAFADAAAERPWLVISTMRDAPPSQTAGCVIELGPLSPAESEQLVVAATAAAPLRPDEVGEVLRRGGGSPLFLGEILEVVRETGRVSDLPESLDAVVGAQIDAIPDLARRLLRYASVLGRSFRKALLDRFLEPEDVALDDWTSATLARFITEDGADRWRFRHAVIRDVAYNGLSYRRRRDLHARAATVIEELAGDELESVAEFLAIHHALAGNHRETWRYSLVAGERARDAYVNIEAAGHFERALEATRRIPDLPEADIARVWIELGDAREAAALYDQALAAFRTAAAAIHDPVAEADLYLKRARVRARVGRYRPAFREITIAEQRLAAEQSSEALAARARLSSLRAQLRQLQEHPKAAIRLALQAVAEAEAASEDEALARSCQVLDASYNMIGQPSKAVYGTRALAIYERRRDLAGIANITNNLGGQAYFEGDWEEALEYYARAEHSFRQAGNEAEAATASANIAEVLVSQRRFGEAEPLLTQAVRTLRAHNLMDAALFAEVQFARLLLYRGDTDEAMERLQRIRDEAASLGLIHSALESAIHLADGLVSRDCFADALELLDVAESDAGPDAELYLTMLARVRSSALLGLGRTDESRSHLERGLTAARHEALRYEEARLLEVEAQLLRAEDDEQACEREAEAARLLASLGVEAPG